MPPLNAQKPETEPVRPRILSCLTPEELASQFGLRYPQLARIIYPNLANEYREFNIKKKSGGFRQIQAPSGRLLRIQRKLLELLEEVYEPRNSTHGFVPGRSILTNAHPHVGRAFVFNVDILDFFPSIHFGRVKYLFKGAPFNFPDNVSTVLAQICCYKNSLPQGAPTSPIISNMICRSLDQSLQYLAAKNQCTYSRYADDITFSSTRKQPPSDIVQFDSSKGYTAAPVLTQIIKEKGFGLNEGKTRFQGGRVRQIVTGLTVNKRVNISNKFIKRTKSMIYAAGKFGFAAAEREYLTKYRVKYPVRAFSSSGKTVGDRFRRLIRGRLAFIGLIRGKSDPLYQKLSNEFAVAQGGSKPYPDRAKSVRTEIVSSEESVERSLFVIKNNITDEQGTAFLLEEYGLVTNAHILNSIDFGNVDCLDVFRPFEPEKIFSLELIRICNRLDFAQLKIHTDIKIPSFALGDSNSMRLGSAIFACGYPNFKIGDSMFYQQGQITQKSTLFNVPAWLVDIPIAHGMSGGPAIDPRFNAIGIVTFGRKRNTLDSHLTGFIPIHDLLEEMIKVI